jgi:hypothetical protein
VDRLSTALVKRSEAAFHTTRSGHGYVYGNLDWEGCRQGKEHCNEAGCWMREDRRRRVATIAAARRLIAREAPDRVMTERFDAWTVSLALRVEIVGMGFDPVRLEVSAS